MGRKRIFSPAYEIERLFFYREIDQATGCWLWTGLVHPFGYGHMSFKGQPRRVHRVAAELLMGFDPTSNLMVLHKCDVRRCFNPDHLYFGSAKDNVRDMYERNRQPNLRGERNGQAKLTVAAVQAIRKAVASGVSLSEIIHRYHVSKSAITLLVQRKNWRHVA